MLDDKEAEEFVAFILKVCQDLTNDHCLNINDSSSINGMVSRANVDCFYNIEVIASFLGVLFSRLNDDFAHNFKWNQKNNQSWIHRTQNNIDHKKKCYRRRRNQTRVVPANEEDMLDSVSVVDSGTRNSFVLKKRSADIKFSNDLARRIVVKRKNPISPKMNESDFDGLPLSWGEDRPRFADFDWPSLDDSILNLLCKQYELKEEKLTPAELALLIVKILVKSLKLPNKPVGCDGMILSSVTNLLRFLITQDVIGLTNKQLETGFRLIQYISFAVLEILMNSMRIFNLPEIRKGLLDVFEAVKLVSKCANSVLQSNCDETLMEISFLAEIVALCSTLVCRMMLIIQKLLHQKESHSEHQDAESNRISQTVNLFAAFARRDFDGCINELTEGLCALDFYFGNESNNCGWFVER